MSLGRHRPLARQHLLLELELMTAADMEPGALARTLFGLATAGLYGMVLGVQRFEMNGCEYETEGPKGSIASLRPPPDARITEAVRDLELVLRSLQRIPGVDAAVA